MRTLQEKYNAIQEGNFSKSQFLRDARLGYPSVISQFNSYEDSVQILKNRGMIAEVQQLTLVAKPEPDLADTIAPDLLDKGIKAELNLEPGETPTEEDYEKAKEIAVKRLAKDPLAYTEKVQLKEETALDRAQDNAATKVQNALGDIADTVAEKPASVAAAFKKMVLADPVKYAKMSAHELEQEFEKFKLEEAQVEEGKSIELSDEEMQKLHKDGKITLPDGSVLHYVGKPANEGDKKEVPASAYPENRHLLTPDELGYDVDEAKALKEAVKTLIKKTLEEGEKVDLTKKLPKLAKPLMDIGKELDQKLKAAGFQTKIFMGKTDVPNEVYGVIEDNEVAAGIAFAQYTDGTGKKEVLDIVTNGNKIKELEQILASFKIPVENGGKPQRFGPNLVQTTIRTSVD